MSPSVLAGSRSALTRIVISRGATKWLNSCSKYNRDLRKWQRRLQCTVAGAAKYPCTTPYSPVPSIDGIGEPLQSPRYIPGNCYPAADRPLPTPSHRARCLPRPTPTIHHILSTAHASGERSTRLPEGSRHRSFDLQCPLLTWSLLLRMEMCVAATRSLDATNCNGEVLCTSVGN